MRQASGKVPLRCFCLPNPSLENINLPGILRVLVEVDHAQFFQGFQGGYLLRFFDGKYGKLTSAEATAVDNDSVGFPRQALWDN